MKTVKEAAGLAGISVRTLHYYDEIGLLKPSGVTEAGYRLYDDAALARLMRILFYRELDFPLADIRRFLDNPAFDRRRAMEQQKRLLLLKRGRLDRLITLLDETMKGETHMDLQAFSTAEIDAVRKQYAGEAEARWGNTEAYAESERKTAGRGQGEWKRLQAEMDEIFRGFAAHRDSEPEAPEVQSLVDSWRKHITRNYYACTREILAGLGALYTEDARFTQTMDQRYGPGTADFAGRAIRAYCEK